MAEIKITELRPTGSELFEDSETFLKELNDDEMTVTLGGNGGNPVSISLYSQNSLNSANSILNTANSVSI